jgi:TorA maturation chaperone TorD
MCDECRFDADALDAGRERIYGFLASVLSHPESGMWGRATDPAAQAGDIAAVDALRRATAAWDAEPAKAGLDLRFLVVELCRPLAGLKLDYDRFFVRSRRNSRSPLEMDHEGAWRKKRPGPGLARLRREYEAADCPEREWMPTRADHVSRELGFMAWLIARSRIQRRLVCLGGAPAAVLRGCDLAQLHFFGHHLAGWLPDLAAELREFEGGGCLEELGRFLAAWINLERRYLKAESRFAEAASTRKRPASRPRAALA